jgi:putative membrane protein
MIRDILNGFLIGIANIIPGVSGGTFALILGIYDRLISAINKIRPAWILTALKPLLKLHTRDGRNEIMENWKSHDFYFLARIMLGAVLLILVLSPIMKMLLMEHREPVYAFFFALVLASIGVPWKQLKKTGPAEIISLLAALALTLAISLSVNPAEKMISNSKRYERRMLVQVVPSEQTTPSPATAVSQTGPKETSHLLVIFLSAMIAISAMVLPGISGSFVLILLGQYFTIISALSNGKILLKVVLGKAAMTPVLQSQLTSDLLTIAVFAAGCLAGLLIFCRLIEFLYRKFFNQTLAALTGLIVGSLYALWPFKSWSVQQLYIKEAGEISRSLVRVYNNSPFLPWQEQATELGSATLAACAAAFIGGLLIMYLFSRAERNT